MWIGAIKLVVQTKDAPSWAGTDNLVQATMVRDNNDLRVLNLDYPTEDDLEPGAIRNYDYSGPTKLPRSNDKTPELPPGIGQSPMPYPGYGFEFSNGLNGHLKIRLRNPRRRFVDQGQCGLVPQIHSAASDELRHGRLAGRSGLESRRHLEPGRDLEHRFIRERHHMDACPQLNRNFQRNSQTMC